MVENRGKLREFCRSSDGISSLDEPIQIPLKNIDYRLPIEL